MSNDMLQQQLKSLLDTTDWLTNAAQTVAFIQQSVEQLNWVGFYLQTSPSWLTLGPFQGKPACNPISFEKGVCGAAATSRQTQRVDDVHAFPGHIACDAASRSELVIPIIIEGDVWGVLDIDSPVPNRFSKEDQSTIEQLCQIFIEASEFD
ncbi:Free methionine-R-sulfoxide reductase [Halomonadaceae bacterium LMG 33818]|uniref:GAF domain-containing protein n=1 Tax=Cernens ardua TaxID=3402176 RepID=UPI003EDBFD88